MDYIHINKRLKTPIYQQIANSIRSAIQNDLLKHHDHLPTEDEICEMFSISNIVVKQAYQSLVDEGLVLRIRGKGTYVSTLKSFALHFNQFDDLETLLFKHDFKKHLILVEDLILPYKLQSLLKKEDSKKWLRLKWVGKLNKTPILIQELYLNPKYDKKIELDSITDYLISTLFQGISVDHEFSVDILSFDQARLLNQDDFSPVHNIRTLYKKNDDVVAILNTLILNEALHFEFILGDAS
jgi:GntR family transcriptional regulator